MNFLGMYRPRHTPMHRFPALVKVAILFAWTVGTLIVSDPISAAGMAVAAILMLISVLPPFKATVKAMLGIIVISALASAYTAWRIDMAEAVDMATDLVGIFALSLAVTGSTPMGELLDLAASAARPFRRIMPPAIPGLMFAIVIRVIPEVAHIMAQSKQALRARGIERSLRGLLTPTATRTVGFALDLGQALHARGIADDAAPPSKRREAVNA